MPEIIIDGMVIIVSTGRIKITKKLEELFFGKLENDETNDIEEDVKEEYIPPADLISQETLDSLEKIEAALPQVSDLTATDQEMDDLAKSAKDAFDNLMDLGMQTDPRFSAEIFSTAGTMLGHAITAKTAKVNKKLKMVDLQLKKAELDRKLAAADPKFNQPTDLGTAKTLDRTELLRMLRDEAKTNTKS